jgi:hypothetical protein
MDGVKEKTDRQSFQADRELFLDFGLLGERKP